MTDIIEPPTAPAPVTWPELKPPPVPAAEATPAEWTNYLAWVAMLDARIRHDATVAAWNNDTAAKSALAASQQALAAGSQAQAEAQRAVGGLVSGVTAESTATDKMASSIDSLADALSSAQPGGAGGGVPIELVTALLAAIVGVLRPG